MPSFVVAYYSLFLVVVGTLLNLFTLLILCRSKFRNGALNSVLHYLRVMAIFDILMLYGWNLDHYVIAIHGYLIQRLTLPLCRFLSFSNYVVPQSSAWFRVFVSFDRYLSLSRLHRTWFNQSKHILAIIACIISCCIALNAVFLFCGCSITVTGTVSIHSLAFNTYPLWDYINLGVYNCAPFLLMTLFNSGVIYHLFRVRHSTVRQYSRVQHRSISVPLLITTFLFLIMTVPATIAFAFFYTSNQAILNLMDCALYSYHILSFPLYFITYGRFRRECLTLFRTCRYQPQVTPVPQILPGANRPINIKT